MDNKISDNAKVYRNTVIRSSTIGNHSIIGDDVFMTGSIVGERCTIERRGMIFYSKFGDYSYTGFNTVVCHTEIGKFCAISYNSSIGGITHNLKRLSMHPFSFERRYGFAREAGDLSNVNGGGYTDTSNPLIIGNDVWIGSNACILRGLTISDGAAIGAGAVVTHNIGPYEIWAGVPARKIGQRFSDEIIEELLRLQWWDWPRDILEKNIEVFNDDELTLRKIRSLMK